jgi:hypothetical protein
MVLEAGRGPLFHARHPLHNLDLCLGFSGEFLLHSFITIFAFYTELMNF